MKKLIALLILIPSFAFAQVVDVVQPNGDVVRSMTTTQTFTPAQYANQISLEQKQISNLQASQTAAAALLTTMQTNLSAAQAAAPAQQNIQSGR